MSIRINPIRVTPKSFDPKWVYDPGTRIFSMSNIWVGFTELPEADELLDWCLEHHCTYNIGSSDQDWFYNNTITCPDDATATLFKLRWT